jgi:hypothetical protein
MLSPTSATQTATLLQLATASESLIVALPCAEEVAAVMVTVFAKLAVSVSVLAAGKVHVVTAAVHVPPLQLARRFAPVAEVAIVIESPTSARQLALFVQPASGSMSVIVAVPEPLPTVAAVIVTVWAKLAVSLSFLAAGKLQALPVVGQVPPDQFVKRLFEPAASVNVSVSPTSATQLVTLVQPASALPSVIVALPVPVPALDVLIVTVSAKLAVSVSPLEPAANSHGLALPVQLPVVQALKRLLGPLVAVIVIESPASATQVVTLVQPASESPSVIVAVPLPAPLVVVLIVTVFAKFAVSVSPVEPAENTQGLVDPVHVPPDQPVKRLPDEAVAVIVIESLTSATQVLTLVQPAAESVSVALPAPAPAVAALTVTVSAKLAVSVSLLEPAAKLQGLALPVQLPVVQALKRLLEPLVAVIVIESPTSATQVVTLVQPASELLSVIDAPPEPLPAVAVLIVTVFAKLAVSVSVFVGAKLQVLPEVGQLPPDQLVKRLAEAALWLNVSESPL